MPIKDGFGGVACRTQQKSALLPEDPPVIIQCQWRATCFIAWVHIASVDVSGLRWMSFHGIFSLKYYMIGDVRKEKST